MTQIHLPKMSASMFGTLTPAEYHAVDRGRTWGGDAATPIASLLTVVGTGPDRSWMADAACRGMDPNAFHPERGERVDAALRICATCPVVEQCRAYGEATESGQHGIWGGASARTRRSEAVKRRLAAEGRSMTCVTVGCNATLRYPVKGLCARCYDRERTAARRGVDASDITHTCAICRRGFPSLNAVHVHLTRAHAIGPNAAERAQNVITSLPDARRNHPAGRNL